MTPITKPARLGARALAAVAAAALALASPTPPASAQTTDAQGYRIGPRDLVEIKVFEVPELNVQRRVDEDGAVDLPLIGAFTVRDLTASQVAARLQAMLEAKYVQRASVSVEIREFRSRPIAVIGAVKTPGNLAVSGRWTLLEAIAAAGGLAPGHGGRILVHRTSANGLSDQIAIDVDRLMVEADPDVNIPVFAGDLVNVPATTQITLFTLGEVASPGAISFASTERITLLSAIARAGGLSDRAANDIVIRRQGADGRQQEIEVNYKRILRGRDPDVDLQANDVIVVKESFF